MEEVEETLCTCWWYFFVVDARGSEILDRLERHRIVGYESAVAVGDDTPGDALVLQPTSFDRVPVRGSRFPLLGTMPVGLSTALLDEVGFGYSSNQDCTLRNHRSSLHLKNPVHRWCWGVEV